MEYAGNLGAGAGADRSFVEAVTGFAECPELRLNRELVPAPRGHASGVPLDVNVIALVDRDQTRGAERGGKLRAVRAQRRRRIHRKSE